MNYNFKKQQGFKISIAEWTQVFEYFVTTYTHCSYLGYLIVNSHANRIFINTQQKSKNYRPITCLYVIFVVIFLQNVKQCKSYMKRFGLEPTHTSVPRVSIHKNTRKNKNTKVVNYFHCQSKIYETVISDS